METSKPKRIFIDAFCGAGGMGKGLIDAGFDLKYAFDINEQAVQTHNYNLGHHCHIQDIRKLNGNKLIKALGIKKGDLDLFAGGPPCQGFSKQRKDAKLGDKRNDLVLEYVRIVNEIMPKAFIFENVAIFGQKRGLKYIAEMNSKLTKYSLFPHFYNCSKYGLAQARERFIVVGLRKDISSSFKIPQPLKKKVCVKDVIGGMPPPPADFTEHPTLKNHIQNRITELNKKRFSYVPQGGGWKDIPYELRLKSHQKIDTSKGGWPDVYGRLSWNGLCPTITGGFDSFTRGRYGHPEENRAITPREAARLQGFPDDFVFLGNKSDVRSQIGNAVPPPLAKIIGQQILKTIKEV